MKNYHQLLKSTLKYHTFPRLNQQQIWKSNFFGLHMHSIESKFLNLISIDLQHRQKQFDSEFPG